MSRKRKRELNEKIKLSQEQAQGNSDKITEDDFKKLKHTDDYRGKIIRDKERFNDKIYDKTSKRSPESQDVPKAKRRTHKNQRFNESLENQQPQETQGMQDFQTSQDIQEYQVNKSIQYSYQKQGFVETQGINESPLENKAYTTKNKARKSKAYEFYNQEKARSELVDENKPLEDNSTVDDDKAVENNKASISQEDLHLKDESHEKDYGLLTNRLQAQDSSLLTQHQRQIEDREVFQKGKISSPIIKKRKIKSNTVKFPKERNYLKADIPTLSQAEIKKKKDFQRRNAKKIRENLSSSQTELKSDNYDNIYNPFSQDLDNDGIIDRYDNDFMDSDYFESTYDVDGLKKDRLLDVSNNVFNDKDKLLESKSKIAQRKLIKRKNYSDKVFTRKKDSDLDSKGSLPDNKESISATSKGKEAIKDKQKKNMTYFEHSKDKKSSKKDYSKKLKKDLVGVSVLGGLAKGSEAFRDYLSYGSDENQGVEAGEKVADASSKLIHGVKNYADKRKAQKSYSKSKNDFKIRKKKSKLEFKDEVRDLKKTEEYKKSNVIKKLQKKRHMKNAIYKQNNTRIRDRIRQGLINTLISAKEIVIKKAKGAILIVIGIIIIGTFVINFSSMSTTAMLNGANSVLTTSYLSNENVLSEVNQDFSNLEQELQDEIDNVEANNPGYDEYIINKNGEIGHEIHELLAYITSRNGQVKDVSEVNSVLNDLFDKMYDLNYDTEIETRYRTEYYSYTDSDGNTQYDSYQVPYEYKKLIVTLNKKEMDTVVREVLADYPDNITHYEALLASQGNMPSIFGSGNGDLSEIINNPDFGNPGIAFDSVAVQQLFAEAEKHIGKRYVFGGNGPSNFDCSSFVCWSFTHSGIKNMPRTTAWGIYKNYCTPISPGEAQAGDIIFFKNTYNSGSPISHVGIYAGNGMMLHAGDPIKYTSINTNYWKSHFYGFGRISGN